MSGLDNEAFRAELREAAGSEPPFEIGGFDDVEQDVRESVRRVRECAFLPHRDAVRGFVYDVAEHRVREIQA
jgi:carbonic anhydrase